MPLGGRIPRRARPAGPSPICSSDSRADANSMEVDSYSFDERRVTSHSGRCSASYISWAGVIWQHLANVRGHAVAAHSDEGSLLRGWFGERRLRWAGGAAYSGGIGSGVRGGRVRAE